MKILILANNDVGLYQFRKELLYKLIKDNEIIISLPNGELIEKLQEIGCKFINTPLNRRGINPFKDIKLLINYSKIIKMERPDIVITYTIKPNIYGGFICRIRKVPYNINITGLGSTFQKKGLLNKIVKIMYKISIKRANNVFFENGENQEVFINEKIVKKENCCLLNGAGVNLDDYYLSDYPIENNEIIFLFLGRIMKEKGINELIEAMKKLIINGVKCSLEVVGECEENYYEIMKKYQNEGWLRYYGYQKDVRPFIKKCNCSVLPSWHEGMSNTNLECAAMGRPIITSNISGCKEAVIDNKTGYLTERKNSNDLYLKMNTFINLTYEERKNMGYSGRLHMLNNFEKSIVVNKTLKRLFYNK